MAVECKKSVKDSVCPEMKALLLSRVPSDATETRASQKRAKCEMQGTSVQKPNFTQTQERLQFLHALDELMSAET